MIELTRYMENPERNADTDCFVILPAGTYIEFTRFYSEEGWLEIVSEVDGQTVWLKLENRDGKFT